MKPLLIIGGRVIDPSRGQDAVADVAIAEGRIAAVGPRLARPQDATVIDAEGLIVTPGLIDPHVHLREPGGEHKETIASGLRAAAAGGFTTVACMPNTDPPLDSPELVESVTARGAREGTCRLLVVACATKGRRGEAVAEIALMARAGAAGFSDDGDYIQSAAVMEAALTAIRPTGRALMQHCQERTLTESAAMHQGAVSTRLGLPGWPRAAEEIAVERDLRLNRDIGCRYHVQHVSSAGTVDLVRRARVAGEPVTAEASPHHLLLTHEACDGYDTLAKVNPPLREAADVEALIAGVADGTITVLATDHAPHSSDEKARPFEAAPFGIVGLEAALALYIEALVLPGVIGWPRLVEMMTLEPARLLGLESTGLGTLRDGAPADVTLIDPDEAWTIDENSLAGLSRNTPFLGRSVVGRAVATIVAGRASLDRLSPTGARTRP